MSEPLLKLDDVTLRFGGLVAVNRVEFSLIEGDLFGLIGPNGAGKTTCFNLVTGLYKPSSGDVYFCGKRINGLAPHKIAKRGISRTFQNIRLFPALSVLENVMVGRLMHRRKGLMQSMFYLPSAIGDVKSMRRHSLEMLEIMNLAAVANSRSADLPYGMQRRLEIARALATDPKLILLDEPAAGMNPQEKEELRKCVRRLRDDLGKTVLLIEHDMRFVMNLCERIVVLDHGEEIAAGPPESIRNDPKVVAAYLGEPAAQKETAV